MRTPTSIPKRTRSNSNDCTQASEPATACDSAPALAPQEAKIRAKDACPAPPFAGGVRSLADHEQAVIEAALAILRAKLRLPGEFVRSPGDARTMALLHFANFEIEVFAVMFFNANHGLIAFDDMAHGTLTQTSVYPREIVRAALRHNASAVILAHNHPSGDTSPSNADRALTRALMAALAAIDVQVLDHLVIGGDRVLSFAEQGIL